MTVGESLAEARSRAGLSIDELSARTRIRGSVIRSIERDDYDACGGDLYARGYVRAIAGAVGIDAQPLIREYDLSRGNGDNGAGGAPGTQPGPGTGAGDPHPATAPAPLSAAPPESGSRPVPAVPDPGTTMFDLPPVVPDPGTTMFDLPPVALDPAGPDDPAAPAPADPAGPMDPAGSADLAPADLAPADLAPADLAPADLAPADLAGPADPAIPPDPADPAATRFDLPPVREDPAATRFDLPPVRLDGEDLMAAGYAMAPADGGTPGTPPAAAAAGPDENAGSGTVPPGQRRRAPRGGRLLAGAGVAALLAAAGVFGVRLASDGTPGHRAAVGSVPRSPTPAATPGKPAGAAKPAPSTRAEQASAKPTHARTVKSAAARRTRTQPPITSLPVAAAEAFGPDGLADGDNPQTAKWAIETDAPLPWSTQWYATPDFGMLKHGTGLLLDLGRRVTVTSVRIGLSQYQGANLQLRVGDGTAPSDLTVAATAKDTGGDVRLKLRHPASGRYLLIWFTLLPPDGSGHYRESVYHVRVNGRR